MSTHKPPRVYFHHSMKAVSLCSPKHWQHHLKKQCPIPCQKCCLGKSRRFEGYISPRELILAESLLNWVNAAQLQVSVVYMHFCFSVEQRIMLLYMQKVLDLFFKCLGTLQWLIDRIYLHCSLKSWHIPHMSPELSCFYWSHGNSKSLAVGLFFACKFNLESSMNEERQISYEAS